MPELPEVETVKRGLGPLLIGQQIERVETRRLGLRFLFPPGFAARLGGAKVVNLSRRGKYILADLDTGFSLLVHLGMTGRFSVQASADGPHDHVVFHMQNASLLVYSDPRRFGMMDLVETGAAHNHKLLQAMGVEPLGNLLTAAYLAQKFNKKSTPLKSALLDQRIIAGLGNIYVCETLFRARLSPKRKAGSVRVQQLEALVRHIRDILNQAILAGGSTLQDFHHADGAPGSYQQSFLVYDREGTPCPNCGKAIKRLVQAGRSSFYCAGCQK